MSMFDCQQSLLRHLGQKFVAPELNTLQPYAGELREPHKLTTLLPACFVVFVDGTPNADQAEHQFEILVVTESRTLDKTTSQSNNLALSSDIASYLRHMPLFMRHSSKGGTYLVDPKRLRARTLAVTERFAIVAITCFIKANTEDII